MNPSIISFISQVLFQNCRLRLRLKNIMSSETFADRVALAAEALASTTATTRSQHDQRPPPAGHAATSSSSTPLASPSAASSASAPSAGKVPLPRTPRKRTPSFGAGAIAEQTINQPKPNANLPKSEADGLCQPAARNRRKPVDCVNRRSQKPMDCVARLVRAAGIGRPVSCGHSLVIVEARGDDQYDRILLSIGCGTSYRQEYAVILWDFFCKDVMELLAAT